jgi:hypothetical protein
MKTKSSCWISYTKVTLITTNSSQIVCLVHKAEQITRDIGSVGLKERERQCARARTCMCVCVKIMNKDSLFWIFMTMKVKYGKILQPRRNHVQGQTCILNTYSCIYMHISMTSNVHKSLAPHHLSNWPLYSGTYYLWDLSIEYAHVTLLVLEFLGDP